MRDKPSYKPTPDGELVLQTVAMPADANVYGDIFGGWVVSQMDLGGAVLAHRRALNRVTTVAIDSMTFIRPLNIGDLVCCYAKVLKTGRTSITIEVDVWAIRMRIKSQEQIAAGIFTYVAIDNDRRPKPVDWDKTAQ